MPQAPDERPEDSRMIIKNPTHEAFELWYSGEMMRLDPGQIYKVDDARGNHALSEFGKRGLIKLEYGDDRSGQEETKSEQGRQANKAFRRKQVIDFNQEQDRKQSRKLPLAPCPEHIKRYANELGIKVFEPYGSSDEHSVERAELIGKLEFAESQVKAKDAAISDLQLQMSQLQETMAAFMASHGRMVNTPAEPTDAEPMTHDQQQEIIAKLKFLNKPSMLSWLDANKDQFGTFPELVRAEISARYKQLFNKELELAA
jgi:hypothetical protein